ncbi:hypothetical protein ACU4GA_24530 [Methylobacterium oryzae CBMB20]
MDFVAGDVDGEDADPAGLLRPAQAGLGAAESRLGPGLRADLGIDPEPAHHPAAGIPERDDAGEERSEHAVRPRRGKTISNGSPVAIEAAQTAVTRGSSAGSWTVCQPQPAMASWVVPQ